MKEENISDKTKKSRKQDPNTYMKKSEDSLRMGLYENTIKEIDKAISLTEEKDRDLPKREKLRILDLFINKASEHLSAGEIDDVINILDIYLNSKEYIEQTEEYIEGIDKTLKMLMSTKLFLGEVEVIKTLKWINKVIDITQDKNNMLIKLNEFIITHIDMAINNSENEEDAISKIENICKYTGKITDFDINHYKMSAYMKFNNCEKIILNIKFKFDECIQTTEGKQAIDKYKDFIFSKCSNNKVDELKVILSEHHIPECLMKMKFSSNFNAKYIISEFEKSIKQKKWDKGHSLFICIEEYFDFLDIKQDVIKKYCLHFEKYFLGIEYFEHHIEKNPKSIVLIYEVAEFIKDLRGLEESKKFLKESINRILEYKEVELQCDFIKNYKLFCSKYGLEYEVKDELKDVKDIDIMIDFIYPIYEEKGTVYLENISKKLIDNIYSLSNEDVAKIINIARNNFNISIHDEIILAQSANEISEFEKSLFILGNLDENFLEPGMDSMIVELEISNYIASERYIEALNSCEVLLNDLEIYNYDEILELYVEKIIDTNEYDRGIKYLKNYLDTNKDKLNTHRKSTIESYIAKIHMKKGNVFLFATNWIKSSYKKYENENTKEFLKVGIILIFIIGMAFQYRMYATGEWNAVSAKPYFSLENIILETGEQVKYKKDIGIKKIPFYSKNPKEKIVIEDPSVLERGDEYIKGLEEGQTDIVLYMDDVEIGRSTVKVADIKLANYTISYEGDPKYVGDVVTPKYEYEFIDHRTKEYDVTIESNNTDVIKIEDGDIKAVGVGKATVSITIGGITKYLPFDIKIEGQEEYSEDLDQELDSDQENPEDYYSEENDNNTSTKDQYIDKISALENDDTSLGQSDSDYIEKEEMKYERWDAMLQEIVDVLESQLSENELDSFKIAQSQWKDETEYQADNMSSQYQDDLDREFIRINTLADLTKKRCSDLVYLYMK